HECSVIEKEDEDREFIPLFAVCTSTENAKTVADALNFARLRGEIEDLLSLHIKLDSGADIQAFANLLERIKEG
ncbi:hypothetical protein LCGC14_2419930, partial [marine sediment metagenome]